MQWSMCRTHGAARNGFGSHAEDTVITLLFYCFQNHFVSDNVNWQQNENVSHPLRAFCTCSSFPFPLAAPHECRSYHGGNQNSAAFKWCRHSPVGAGSKEGEFIAGKGLVLLWRDLLTESTPSRGCAHEFWNWDLGIAWCFPGRAWNGHQREGNQALLCGIAHGFGSLYKAQEKHTFLFDIQFFKFYCIKTAKPH